MTLNRYYTMINLIVLSVIIYGGVDIFYTLAGFKLIEVNTESRVAKQGTTPSVSGKRRNLNYYTPAVNRDLFGEAEELENSKDDINVQDLEPTALKVTLLGTVSGDDKTATAIIEEKAKRKQALYKEGDTIQDATIVKILRGKVVLRIQDKNQILTMEENTASSKSVARRTAPRRAPRPATPSGSDRTISLDRATISKSLENITELLSQVRIRPHYKNGQPDGLLLSQVKPNTVFTKLGLRNGDIIQGVDGNSVENADDVMDFYDEIKSGSSVSLDIMRRGRKQKLNYEFE